MRCHGKGGACCVRTRADRLDCDRLRSLLMRRGDLFARIECGVEQRVDERRLAETGFSNNHRSEVEALAHTLSVYLVWQVGETDIAHQLFATSGHGAGGTASLCGRSRIQIMRIAVHVGLVST